MTQTTPPPNTEAQEEAIQEKVTQGEFHFIPGELEPIAPKKKFPAILKQAFRPMFFGAIGIHALLLFTPLSSPQQTKPKETAEPVKLARLSDKVLVKSMPKVKVAAAPKKVNLPKIAVASTNPVIVNLPEPEKAKTEENKTEPEKLTDKKLDDKQSKDSKVADGKLSDKGVDPSKVDPSKATTNEKDASKLDEGTQKFAPIINGLNKALNPAEETAAIPEKEQLINSAPFFKANPPPVSGAVISNKEVDEVIAGLRASFPDKFSPKGSYAGTQLYEAKVGDVTRYISIVKADNVMGQNVLVFLWEKPPA